MLMTKYISIILLCGLFLLSACQKEDIQTYTDAERINFDLRKMDLKKDSVEISLGFFSGEIKELPLHLYAIGYKKNVARKINIRISSADGAVAGTTYELPEVIELPANELECIIPLNIMRDPELQTKAKSFLIELGNSDAFVPGVYTSLYVKVTDGVPTTWIGDDAWGYGPKLVDYFGVCSRTKYLFVYDRLGIYDFSVWTYYGYMGDATKCNAAKQFLKKELAAYEKEYGPLVDPVEGRVTFPD